MKSEKSAVFGVLAGGVLAIMLLCSTGCQYKYPAKAADMLNPFAEGDPDSALGERNTNAILDVEGQGGAAERARHALEVLGTYRRTQSPQPVYPVIEPAEVRLMWVPDHINRGGDLVPSHYYYLLVRLDRWALQDAFDIEGELSGGEAGATAKPWVYKGGR